jgi:hypothetical protein
LNKYNAGLQTQAAQANAAAQNQFSLAKYAADNQINSQAMDIASRENLARYAAEMDAYQKQLQRNQDLLINNLGISANSADRIYASTMDAIAKIQGSAMEATDKENAIADLFNQQMIQGQVVAAITGQSGFANYLR